MLLMPEESSSSKNVRNGYYATATPEVPGIAMPDKTAKKTLAGALAALGEGQFAMSEASVHVSLVFERNFDMPHAANFLPFKVGDLFSWENWQLYFIHIPGGAATCSEGFVVCFLKVPLAC